MSLTNLEHTQEAETNDNENHTLRIPTTVTIPYYGGAEPPARDDMKALLTEVESAPVTVELTDVRSNIERYSLDTNGFQYVKDKKYSSLAFEAPDGLWYEDRDETNRVYIPHLERLLTETLKSGVLVIPSNPLIRNAPKWASTDLHNYYGGRQAPAPRPHVDYSSSGSYNMLRNMHRGIFEDNGRSRFVDKETIDAAMSKKNEVVEAMHRCAADADVPLELWDGSNYDGPRWMILSVWRPLEMVRRDPLAVMDSRSFVSGEDTYRVSRWYDRFVGFNKGFESWVEILRPPMQSSRESLDRHGWHWMPGQGSDDVLLIKIFDSDALRTGSTVAGPAPHVALSIDGTDNEPVRKSIEVRCYLFW